MTWESGDGMRIEVSEKALASIRKYISSCRRGETGGILVGRYSNDLLTAEVLSASGPGPHSLLGQFSFTRKAFGLQRELDREFESGRYYLGEWHCHPGGDSTPSCQDIHQMRLISRSEEYNCPEPILMVFGRSNPCVFITVRVIRDNQIIDFIHKGAS